MSRLFTAASSFANEIAETRRTCYWYGDARIAGGAIVAQPVPAGKCTLPPPMPAAGANIGWPAEEGFALVGRDASQQALAYTDCTGFAAWLIADTSFADFQTFVQWVQTNRKQFLPHPQPWPSAAAYAYAGYADQPIGGNWRVVANATAPPETWTQLVQPGDILAWDIPKVAHEVNDTGHVLVLASPLQPASESQYQVRVIDCSRFLHGDDSRHSGTGVGTGVIRLQYTGGIWHYSFGTPHDAFHAAPHISVLRLDVD